MDVNHKKKYCTDLKNVKQWLRFTKTRCDSLKSHMEYMKMLYHDIPKIQKPNKTVDGSNCQNSKTKVFSDEITISKQMDLNDISKEFTDIPCTSPNHNGSDQAQELHLSSDLENIIPKINLQYKDDEETKIENIQRETEIELSTKSPKTYSIQESTHIQSRPLSPIQTENMYREQNHWKYPYQKDLEQYSMELIEDVNNPEKLFEQLVLNKQNEYLLQEFYSTKDDMKLNNSGSIKDGSIDKHKVLVKNTKNDKMFSSSLSSKKGSCCKLDNNVSLKLKRRKRKIHCSNSKSTVTTKDTNFLGRKEMKKRKQKSHASSGYTSKPQQTPNEVVEIYHNRAATSGSTCVVSNKYSKLDVLSSATSKQKTLNVKPQYEYNDYQEDCYTDLHNQQNNSQKQYLYKEETEISTLDKNCELEVPVTPSYPVEKCNSHQCEHSVIQASYCDPLITHNYEMPTLASKLKRANRSYFSRFNFRNIPFVVGTSVTPSHNLGLNIQQVLSIMKTKQSTINGITPLLIRKVSRGMKPVSILMEQMNDQYNKLSYVNSRVNSIHVQKENSLINQTDHLLENGSVSFKYDKKRLNDLNISLKSTINQYQNIPEIIKTNINSYENYKKKDTKSDNQLNTPSTSQILQTTNNAKLLKLFTSQQNLKLDDNKQIYHTSSIDDSKSSKGIQEVLIHLHDQFEEMNVKYEKLQEKAKKCNNKNLEEEIMNLEKDLNAKEDEINAVINLYKEVMLLKHQMRLLQEKNSYICISTEIPLQSNKAHSTTPLSLTKSYGTNDQVKLNHKRGNSVISTREPTSIRLAGLLRQIQMFQRQLKLSS